MKLSKWKRIFKPQWDVFDHSLAADTLIASFYGKTAQADAEAYIQMKEQQETAVKNITESDIPDLLMEQAS